MYRILIMKERWKALDLSFPTFFPNQNPSAIFEQKLPAILKKIRGAEKAPKKFCIFSVFVRFAEIDFCGWQILIFAFFVLAQSDSNRNIHS